MSHPPGEMFSKNRLVLQKLHIVSNNAGRNSPLLCLTCNADRSGAHGTRKVTLPLNSLRSSLRNVLEQTTFTSKLRGMLICMSKSVDSVLVTFSLDARKYR